MATGVSRWDRIRLELIPEVLIVDFVVELHFGSLHDGSKQAGATVGRGLLQIRVTALHVRSEKGCGPFGRTEVLKRGVDVVRQAERYLPEGAGGTRNPLCPLISPELLRKLQLPPVGRYS